MAARERATMPDIVGRYGEKFLPDWIRNQLQGTVRRDLLRDDELQAQSRRFLDAFRRVLANGGAEQDITAQAWEETRDVLGEISQSRARQGFSPSETATFVFSLKQPLFERLRTELAHDPAALADEIWKGTTLLDQLGLYTTEVYQKGRDETIARQQQEMLELSTPVVELWEGILALPLIGTLDSERTQIAMRQHLVAGHHVISEAATGEEALRLAQAEHFDLICLDLGMPDMEGTEVLRRLRSDPGTRDIPVVIVTAMPLDDAGRKQLGELSAHILSKDAVSREGVLDAVGAALRLPAGGS